MVTAVSCAPLSLPSSYIYLLDCTTVLNSIKKTYCTENRQNIQTCKQSTSERFCVQRCCLCLAYQLPNDIRNLLKASLMCSQQIVFPLVIQVYLVIEIKKRHLTGVIDL